MAWDTKSAPTAPSPITTPTTTTTTTTTTIATSTIAWRWTPTTMGKFNLHKGKWQISQEIRKQSTPIKLIGDLITLKRQPSKL